MIQYWERLAEAQRIRQEIEAEFVRAVDEFRKSCDGRPAGAVAVGLASALWPPGERVGVPPRRR